MTDDPRRTHRWRMLRPRILDRDEHVCQIRGPRCTYIATTVDHVVPLSRGGEPFDPLNLRAACVACNSGRGNGQRRRPRPRPRPAIGYSPLDPPDWY